MPLNVISNFAANVAHRNLTMSDAQATNSLAKLSAGTRVLSAKDDAASMAIGARLRTEVAGLKTAAVNAGQAISMLQIGDGAMSKVSDILTRMKSLAIQAGSEHLGSQERAKLDTEYQALVSEVDRVSNDTEFAGALLVDGGKEVAQSGALNTTAGVVDIVLLGSHEDATNIAVTYDDTGGFTVTTDDGSSGTITFTAGALGTDVSADGSNMDTGAVVTLTNTTTSDTVEVALNTTFDNGTDIAATTLAVSGTNVSSFTFKVGTGVSASADNITVNVNGISATSMGVNATDLTTSENADIASSLVSGGIDSLSNARANIGANQNRLEFAVANLATVTENTEAARSQLLDLDVAAEMSNFTSKQILVQAGVSMLAQANQLPQNLLRLFN